MLPLVMRCHLALVAFCSFWSPPAFMVKALLPRASAQGTREGEAGGEDDPR